MIDASNLLAEFRAKVAEFKQQVQGEFDRVGANAVEVAKSSTAYRDRTGNLRSCNEYEADEDHLVIRNTADYASYVEARTGNVTADAVLYAKNELGATISNI